MSDADFSVWLHRQAHRDDHIGRLSRAVAAHAVGAQDLRSHVLVAALDQARAEHRGQTRHPSERNDER